jgi:hypothetical protein
MIEWLDDNCGSDGWMSMPSSTKGVVNDALAIYFADVILLTTARRARSQQDRRSKPDFLGAPLSRHRHRR